MSSATSRALRASLLVAAMGIAVAVGRPLLDAVVAPSGWFLLPFVAVFVAARVEGPAAGLAMTAVVLASDAIARNFGWVPDPAMPATRHLLVDLGVSATALLTALALRRAGRRYRARDRAAQASELRLLAAARREGCVRQLAAEVADPRSARQVADRFAVRALAMTGAAGVAVFPIGSRAGERAAGGPPDAPMAVAGDLASIERPGTEVSAAIEHGAPLVIPPVGSGAAGGRVVVPLVAGTGSVAVAVVALARERTMDEDDLAGLALLGRIAADAIARAELSVLSRLAAARATEAAERMRRLQGLVTDLGRELERPAIARLVVDAAAAGLGATVGILHGVDTARGELDLVHARGYPAGLVDRERRLPLDAALPAPEAVRARKPVVVSADAWAARFPGASAIPAIAGLAQIAAVPLGTGDPLAVLLVGRPGREPFTVADVAFLETVAEHGAQALQRAALVDQLRARDRRLGLTLGVARAGTWELDLTRRTFEASPALLRIYGLPEDGRLPHLGAYLEHVDPMDREVVEGEIERAASGGGAFTLEFRGRRHDGSAVRVLSVGRTFPDEAGRPARLMAIDRDVTPERAAEAERERLLEQEREARRLHEAFFGVMSHELRTPVTTILGGARLLGRDGRAPGSDREILDDIAGEAERLHRLIEDLLVLSRLERGNLVLAREPVHVGHLVGRVVDQEARHWPHTRFEAAEPERDAVGEGEETYVEQVLRNLLSNAAKYSPAGSTVRIGVSLEGGEVVVRVLDQGPGVGSTEVGDLFSLFYRSPATAAAASGAGIGLFVCDRLIRAMGGRIWARRRPDGRGSEFGFALAHAAIEEPEAGDMVAVEPG